VSGVRLEKKEAPVKLFTLCLLVLMACAVIGAVGSVPAYAVDGVVLINQNIATNGLPGCGAGFPIFICQPGSYRLSGNLVVSADTDGIDIGANDVTLDLNGFTISGPGTCSGTPPQIFCSGSTGYGINLFFGTNVVIRNGIVRNFQIGIFIAELRTSFNSGVISSVEEITAYHNTGGISVTNALVRRNNASFNGGIGISASHSTVLENVANGNEFSGLSILYGVYGSNTFDGNSFAVGNTGGVSQGNNSCGTGSPC